ncbi:PAS domain-containing protein [Rhodoligotrophos defluvii]|uniref:PAS domain-containing protein n=1 Tax=Rhodoligotrophos defluvii TaxID=2561934 RepID=UPI0010C9BB78|nr:PAS domain-containing protein [Rhodoligotrophos defluvii]
MSTGAVPSLDALQHAGVAAWLWDPARARIVWANEAAIGYFGGESLFDLIDRRFDRREPGVARLASLADTLVRPGQSSEEVLDFPSSPMGEPLACDCHVHRLSDGRPGLLVVAKPIHAGPATPPAELALGVIDALPQAVLTLDRDGRSLHANAQAGELLADARRRGLAELLGDERSAMRFISRVLAAGVASEVRRVDTRYGARDLRLEGRRIEPHGGEAGQGGQADVRILLLIDDVAERRALERSLQDNVARLADFVAAAADFTFELDRDLAWQEVGADFTEATGIAAEEIVGQPWRAVAERFGFDRDGVIAAAMADGRSWRATIEWHKAEAKLATCLSAVAVADVEHSRTAYRGIGALIRRETQDPLPIAGTQAADSPSPAPMEHTATGSEAASDAPVPDAAEDSAVDAVAPQQATPMVTEHGADRTAWAAPAPGPGPQRESQRPGLSPEDAAAFERLARRLRQDIGSAEPEPAAAPASDEDAPRTEAVRAEAAAPLAAIAEAVTDIDVLPPQAPEPEPTRSPDEGPAMEAPGKAHVPAETLAVTLARQLMGGLDAPSLIHRDGEILAANKGAAEVLGYDSPEALEVVGLDAVLPGWRVRGEEACVSTPEGRIASNSITARTLDWPDGPVRQLMFTPRDKPLPGKSAQSELWAPSDATLKTILETATDGIIVMDAAGVIRSINAGAQAIFGIDAREAVGRRLSDFLNAESAKTFKDYLAAMVDGSLATIFNDGREVTGIERQGGEIPLFLTISPVVEGDGYCAVLRDITHWKKAEADLRAAKEEAERTSAQKSEFLANISHELRTPLNAILGFSEVMKAERFGAIRNDKYLSYIGDIHASGEHLLSLINDLLDLSKVEAGKLELNFTAVNLVDLIDQSVHIMQDQAREARVLMRTSIPAALPPVVADQRSIRQIVLNLLSNAIKFTEPGGQVIVSLVTTPQGEVKLRVKDTGIGMTEDELQDALKPFRRLETKRRRASGTGLGLPLTKALTEANRAGFSISSRPESGTLVEITFPTTRVLAE